MNPFALLIPRLWTPEEAVAAVKVLRQFIDAIWEVHGEEMAFEIGDHADRWALDELVGPPEPPFPDEDIPF